MAREAFTTLTEEANNGARMFPPESYADQAKEIQETVAALQQRVSRLTSCYRALLTA